MRVAGSPIVYYTQFTSQSPSSVTLTYVNGKCLIDDLTQSRETECVWFGRRNGSPVTVVVCREGGEVEVES
ncbi:hypothetical protein CDV36_016495 [Fusarium kuroshium]|uniref:Uncharacterized protein n=1 Tax=Fusarium kuroshium TaxID=2010991 RepID=A0A3M2QM47_9HYPO|nr:hypothetical protein CDV36_016495 [Fusarium kuroshium]